MMLTIAAGLSVRALLDGTLAKYLGVTLYAVMMVWLVLLIRPSLSMRRAALIALLVCWSVETLQLTPIPAAINAHMPLMRLVLGQHFSWWDMWTYLAVAASFWAAAARAERGTRTRRAARLNPPDPAPP